MSLEPRQSLFDFSPADEDARKIYTVTALTREIKRILDEAFPAVWVVGEISNARQYSSGHIYFTLKDENAQLSAVIWRGVAQRLKFKLEDGIQVLAFGRVEVYEPRGQYQLIVSRIEPKGYGALQLAFEQLKRRLAAEGLFDAARKKPLPRFPSRIGIVTSPDGAAIRDILNILGRRFPKLYILLRPVRVQGDGAAEEIAQGIRDLNKWGNLDVIIVGRGGGSLEDLWAFNEEIVARAIAKSRIPIISAVGHEIDYTIADFAADRRAATPSEAAEKVVPVLEEVLQQLDAFERRLQLALQAKANDMRQRLERLAQSYGMRLPLDRIMQLQQRLDELQQRLNISALHATEIFARRLNELAGRLASLDPHAVLARGYSITFRTDDGSIIRRSDQIAAGDGITTKLHKGYIESVVSKSLPEREEKRENKR
ncbi:MAG: exodeoxyribonuclease VII large subunit [Planctomycetota bacterium]|nr:MAG: exodeoxyribonuclease VII large subunit [Planctomycetota bacterium]